METSPGSLGTSYPLLVSRKWRKKGWGGPPWGWRARPGQACRAQAVLARGKQILSPSDKGPAGHGRMLMGLLLSLIIIEVVTQGMLAKPGSLLP